MSRTERILTTLRAMAPGLVVSGLVALLPEPWRTRVADGLFYAGGALLLAASWWLWRLTRTHLGGMTESSAEMTRLVDTLRAHAAEHDAWRERVLATHRKAREHFAAKGDRAVAKFYDDLIADLEGRPRDGVVN